MVDLKGKVSALVLAAGQGLRMGLPGNKALAMLGDKPVLAWSLEAFCRRKEIAEIIIAAAPGEEQLCEEIGQTYAGEKFSRAITGGASRQLSVAQALPRLSSACSWVMIHDAARPFIRQEELSALFAALTPDTGAILAVPAKDTIKEAGPGNWIKATLKRESLFLAQTPQVFPKEALLTAYEKATAPELVAATDDAALLEAQGYGLRLVTGDYTNLKLTTPEDWLLALALLEQKK